MMIKSISEDQLAGYQKTRTPGKKHQCNQFVISGIKEGALSAVRKAQRADIETGINSYTFTIRARIS